MKGWLGNVPLLLEQGQELVLRLLNAKARLLKRAVPLQLGPTKMTKKIDDFFYITTTTGT